VSKIRVDLCKKSSGEIAFSGFLLGNLKKFGVVETYVFFRKVGKMAEKMKAEGRVKNEEAGTRLKRHLCLGDSVANQASPKKSHQNPAISDQKMNSLRPDLTLFNPANPLSTLSNSSQPIHPGAAPEPWRRRVAALIGPYSHLFPPILRLWHKKNSQFFSLPFYGKPLGNQAKTAQKTLPNDKKKPRILMRHSIIHPMLVSRFKILQSD
jgi:hypothetical protein